MKFKKIDEKTVCCILSNEDLTDNDITIEDFLQNREKVQSFLEEIIESAKEEIGFQAKGSMLSIQIMASYPDGIMITFSEDPKDMAAMLKNGLAGLKGEFEGDGWVEANTPKLVSDTSEKEERKIDKMLSVFRFKDMDSVLDFVKNTVVRSGLSSSLYKNEETMEYYMILERIRMSEERYRTLICTAMEFGELIGATKVQSASVMEHGTCIIPEKAINALKKVLK